MGEGVAAARPAGWPVNVPDGVEEPKGKSRRVPRQVVRRFELMLDLNRPSHPRMRDLLLLWLGPEVAECLSPELANPQR
jgi:hypothetical protein